jgi:hypothetical protein
MSKSELTDLIKTYLSLYFSLYATPLVKAKYNNHLQTFLHQEVENMLGEVLTCALLNNFFWGVWGLALLTPENCCTKGIFNYDCAKGRMEMFKKMEEVIGEWRREK